MVSNLLRNLLFFPPGEGTFQLSKLQNGNRALESLPITRKGKGAG